MGVFVFARLNVRNLKISTFLSPRFLPQHCLADRDTKIHITAASEVNKYQVNMAAPTYAKNANERLAAFNPIKVFRS